eukprot:GHVN01104723.1.p1 GENE.GHVN01104723.1~~GHVN01104723.1.p1  ORF type:complete len:238 (-),score=24.18 GHVN01104723.1:1479-2192(-)
MRCCGCAGNQPRCKKCVCVKAGRKCTDWRRGFCHNQGDQKEQNASVRPRGDEQWYEWWRKLARCNKRMYDITWGAVGRRFVDALSGEVKRLSTTNQNSERLFCMFMAVLVRVPGVKRQKDVRAAITNRLDQWEKADFESLIDNAYTSLTSNTQNRQSRIPDETQNQRKAVNMAKRNRLTSAMRMLMTADTRVLTPDEVIEMKEDGEPMTVMKALKKKHPTTEKPIEQFDLQAIRPFS